MSGYEPKAVEAEVYQAWESAGHFHAEPVAQRPAYSVVIPPPNVTGALHLGHALNNTLQDILIRTQRMRGFATCWLPGTDHAGIATQAVVEKRLREEQGLSRHDVGRDGLVQRIRDWKDDYEQRILGQLRRMGCSCDWQRTRFTLDDQCAKAVYETFFRMFRDGLIYRGTRLVNWDTQLQTAVADDEVYYEDVRGHIWQVRYPLAQAAAPGAAGMDDLPPDAVAGRDYLIVATTRPETMLADTAVAVHPADERYKHLIGRQLLLPLTGRTIPIIADGLLVNPEFGTGCVKVTPGHDPNDYACWQRNPSIGIRNMMTPDGKVDATNAGAPLTPGGPGRYAGLKMDEARKRIVADLDAAGLLEKVEPYETSIGHSDRSKTQIQPWLSEQWFLKMDRLAELAMEAVRDGRVRFFPERFTKSYLDWLGEKRDWCISRQLWWGHRIPVWSAKAMMWTEEGRRIDQRFGELLESTPDPGQGACIRVFQETISAMDSLRATGRQTTSGTARQYYLCLLSHPEIQAKWEASGFTQDPDVLDTWFSSALWPHSTFGWPDAAAPDAKHAADLSFFYPTSALVTNRDIISLWVARMVMTGLYNTGRVPFQHVVIHPTIQDGQGRRMSKSAGNGVDPLDLIEIYGADAMRWVLASMAGETQDARIPVVYLCPHCGKTTPQTTAHLGKPVVACKECKQEFATRLADSATTQRLRLGLCLSERFEVGRNFVTKLWQVANGFVFPNLAEAAAWSPLALDALEIEDRWILSRLRDAVQRVDVALSRYHFNDVTATLYDFLWNDFCDWYVELVKPRLYTTSVDSSDDAVAARASAAEAARPARATDASSQTARRVLALVLDQVLRLLHPITPFVTEALWKKLGDIAPQRGLREVLETAGHLIIAPGPSAQALPDDLAAQRALRPVLEVVTALRQIRTQVNAIRSGSKQPALRTLPRAAVRCDADRAELLTQRVGVLQRLGQVDAVEIGSQVGKPPGCASQVLAGIEVFVPLAGLADLEVERQRLRKERDDLAAYVQRIVDKLSNASFVSKAPPAVIESERERQAEAQEKLAAVERNLAELG